MECTLFQLVLLQSPYECPPIYPTHAHYYEQPHATIPSNVRTLMHTCYRVLSYVCTHMLLYPLIHTHTHMQPYPPMYTHMLPYSPIHTHMLLYSSIHTHTQYDILRTIFSYAYTRTHLQQYFPISKHTHMPSYLPMHTHTHTCYHILLCINIQWSLGP